MTFGNFKVEIKRGPAPDSSKGLLGVGGAVAAARRLAFAKEEEKIQSQMRAAEEAAARAGKDTAANKQALSVVAKLNAQMRASKLVLQSQLQMAAGEASGSKATTSTSSDSSDYHAIIPINDYPQKARWRVTNKETMVQVSIVLFESLRAAAYRIFLFTAHRYDWCLCHEQRHLLRTRKRAAIRRAA